jgi:hypothetical protein
MKLKIINIILILAIPALSHGSIGPDPRLEFPVLKTVVWNAYHLELEGEWHVGTLSVDSFELTPVAGEDNKKLRSLDEISGGIPHSGRPSPKDMVSMMSFVWAEMFGGVDIVAEVKDFARQLRRKNRPAKVSRSERRDSRNRWRFIVACRIDEQTEVAASFKNRGRLFGDGNVVLEINALDPVSEEIGLTMAYSDGDFDIRADRMTLTETAAAKLELKF